MLSTRVRQSFLVVLAVAATCLTSSPAAAQLAPPEHDGKAPALAARSTIYGGGPFYSGGQSVMNTLRSSGFTTVVLWTIHVNADSGDLWYNDHRIIAGGKYVGDSGWPGRLKTLKQAPTSINRIEVGVGSAGPDDWGAIEKLIGKQGTGSNSVLHKNFKVLKQVTGADAINNDDEQNYDLKTTTQFAKMVGSMGYKFTFVPYTNTGFWTALKSNLGNQVDHVYLQAYAGGTGNNPGSWSKALKMPVDPGLWSKHGSGCSAGDSPSTVESKMKAWRKSAGISGGFMWLFDDMQKCSAQGSPKAYAGAINKALG